MAQDQERITWIRDTAAKLLEASHEGAAAAGGDAKPRTAKLCWGAAEALWQIYEEAKKGR